MEFNKKAISPVVATALLLVVAVVAVVGFQNWFISFQSGVNANVEKKSDLGNSISIERLENVSGKTNVYIKNGGTTDITGVTVKVNANGCADNTSVTLTKSTTTTVLMPSSCSLTKGDSYDVVVVTPNGVKQATLIARG